MKLWINMLFYSICFFLLATAIYRLAFCIPPIPENQEYAGYCMKAGAFAVLVAGMMVGLAAWFISREEKRNKEEEKEE